jgi:uncharacterized protein
LVHPQIDAQLFLQMMRAGAKNLSRHVETINALNVFPVPDGDTGTNMNLTFLAGVQEMEVLAQVDTVGKLAEALSKGLLMGARGNSGVILSQLFRGFAKTVSDKTTVDARQLADAFQRGVETAYQAVIKPVEGTILTVAREAVKAGMRYARNHNDPAAVMAVILHEARRTLASTPEMLPVLKQTGVVDAGGQGLVFIYEGILAAIKGEVAAEEEMTAPPDLDSITKAAHQQNPQALLDPAEIQYGYCTEFMIRLHKSHRPVETFVEEKFRQEMARFGDSLLVIADEELVKVHIHAEYPGDALNFAMKYGELTRMKIDNMREQHEQVTTGTKSPSSATPTLNEKKKYGIVAVATGAGIAHIFRSLGVDVVIEGGQTMNPSTQEIAQALAQMAVEQVIILPNNKNIILTAEQVDQLVSIPITVLPTKTIPQGLAALIAFSPEATLAENQQKMMAASTQVRSGEITHAVRDTQVGDFAITAGDYLGIEEGNIKRVGKDLAPVAQALLEEMVDEDTEVVTIIYGKEVDEGEAKALTDRFKEKYSDVEVEVHAGEQPLYYYLFSVESTASHI